MEFVNEQENMVVKKEPAVCTLEKNCFGTIKISAQSKSDLAIKMLMVALVAEHPQAIARAIADALEAWWLSEGKPLPLIPSQKTLEERVQALEAWRDSFSRKE